MLSIIDNLSKMYVLWIVLITFTPVSIASINLHAAILESEMIGPVSQDKSRRKIEEIKVRKALENKIVSKKLMQYGLTSEEAQNKIELMTDEEIHQLAILSDRITAGGNGAVGFVVGVLVIAALVLLIIYLAKRI